MTKSESKARKILNNKYPNGFIKKIPDYKQTGSMSGGLPDYLVINNGKYIWYEIKLMPFKNKTINIKTLFTDQQIITFDKIYKCKGNIKILLFHGKDMYLFNWQNMRCYNEKQIRL